MQQEYFEIRVRATVFDGDDICHAYLQHHRRIDEQYIILDVTMRRMFVLLKQTHGCSDRRKECRQRVIL